MQSKFLAYMWTYYYLKKPTRTSCTASRRGEPAEITRVLERKALTQWLSNPHAAKF